MTLGESDYPDLYAAADSTSLAAQNMFLLGTKARLIALVIAGLAATSSWNSSRIDWGAFIATTGFAIALSIEVYLLANKPEATWYEGRAAAESIKTLAWRYAVGGEPFGLEEADKPETDKEFIKSLRQILADLKSLDLDPPKEAGQITAAMRRLRAFALKDRMAAYEMGRIEDQRTWYSKKSRWNKSRAIQWSFALIGIELAGFLGSLGKALDLIEIDLLGIAGTLAAAGAAWLQTKQHRTLARAYSVAAHELSSIKSMISTQMSEREWAQFMNESEEAISREHTLWRASRGVKS